MYTHSIHNPFAVRFGGPLAPLASGFREELTALGYATSSATEQLRVAAHLSRWLEAEGLDVHLSSSQVYRLVVERPEWLSRKILMALLDILDCAMTELIEPAAACGGAKSKAAGGTDAGIAGLRPKRARVTSVER